MEELERKKLLYLAETIEKKLKRDREYTRKIDQLIKEVNELYKKNTPGNEMLIEVLNQEKTRLFNEWQEHFKDDMAQIQIMEIMG